MGSNAIVDGNIRAAGSVTIQGGAHVLGNVDAGKASGLAVTLGSNADVDGTITRNAGTTTSHSGSATYGASVTGAPAAPTPYVATTLPAASVCSSGVLDQSLGGGSTLTLAPGSYDDINLGSNSVLNLSSGTYYFDTWTLNGGIDINFDLTSGNVLLYFTGGVVLGSNANVTLLNGDASDIYAETRGSRVLNGGGEWFGTIFATGATSDITFGSNSDLTGALWATRTLTFGGGSTANYVLADHVAPQPPHVPEPTVLGLLAVGLVGGVARARRRRMR